MNFIPKFLLNLFYPSYVEKKKPTKRFLKDVKPGDNIQIEWERIKGVIGYLKCLNNDPDDKKILLEVSWGNYKLVGCEQKQRIILRYDSMELRNFNLLNPLYDKIITENTKQEDEFDDTDLIELQKQLNDALDNEQYELAEELQKKVDKILNK